MESLTPGDAIRRVEQMLEAGHINDAEVLCRDVLRAAPSTPAVRRLLGIIAYRRGRLAEAVEEVKRSLALAPDEALAHDNLSLYLEGLGRHTDAEAAARQALFLQPTLAAASHNLGLALLNQGRAAEAELPLLRSLAYRPNDANAWNNLGAALSRLGRLPEALDAFARAVKLAPGFALAAQNLQRFQAENSVRRPAPPMPVPPPSNLSAGALENNRGVQLLGQRRYAEAEAAFRAALTVQPDLPPEVWYNLGNSLLAQDKLADAEPLYRRVLGLMPRFADCHLRLAHLLFHRNRLTEAEASFRRVLELQPENVEALVGLGAQTLNFQGRIEEARATYERALALRPDLAGAHSYLLFNEHYAAGITAARLAEMHAGWQRQYADGLRSHWKPFPQARDPERPLRLGFVSADFYHHPVGTFLAPLLERLDRSLWQTTCYYNHPKTDGMTQRLARAATQWRPVYDLSDDALAELIRGDGIDLLFDLSGHTPVNRLLTFAKPAPIQLTWMAYVGTTGLAAMDYLIADRFHVPPGQEQHYCEKILRMPDSYLCYEIPPYAPPITPLPAPAEGRVTFGCFNNTSKVGPTVVALWSAILKRVPNSRLVLKYHWLEDQGLRKKIWERFGAEGISPERIELLGSTTHVEQLRQYGRIDLALDPFPYSGGLTTCEASCMGIPVLTCPGESFAGRHSLSYLSNIGVTELIVRDKAEYLERAVSLANDLPRLAELRAGLRERMAKAPVCDISRFAGHLTEALRGVWREWCAAK